MFLDIGGYEWLNWHLHPDAVLLCLVLIGAYLYTINVLRPRISDAGRVKRSQIALFSLGVLVIYAASGSPLHDLSERYLLSAHMFQHLLLALVAPPLLLAGTPAWLWQALFKRPAVFPAARLALNPLVTFAAFNGLVLLTHLPPVMDLSLRQHWFHFFTHAALVITALMMWWPVLSTVPELPQLSYPLQMGYLFVQSLLPAVIAAFMTFSTGAIYNFYAQAPRIWGITPVEDQQLGALVMKLLGSLILWSFIAVVFFKWYAREEAEARGPRWQEVEDELRELGLRTDR